MADTAPKPRMSATTSPAARGRQLALRYYVERHERLTALAGGC
jgi:hypothetical protein